MLWERAEELREVGAGLLLTANAGRMLRWLGLFEAAAALGRTVRQWKILDGRGRALQTFCFGEDDASLSIARSELQQILQRQLPPASIRLGCEAVSLVSDSARGVVNVTAANGERCEAGIVVGADGGRSAVRAAVFGASEPRIHGYVGWRGLVDLVPDAWSDGRITESWADGCRFGIAPVNAERSYWYATENLTLDDAPPREHWKSHLLTRFRAWHHPIAEMIEATPDERILLSSIADHASPPPRHTGPVTLLGDAAHLMTPNLGQGAAMALEDACVLADYFAREGCTASALRRYELVRRQRTRAVNWISRQVGRLIQLEHPALCRLRDMALRMTPNALGRLTLAPIFDYRAL